MGRRRSIRSLDGRSFDTALEDFAGRVAICKTTIGSRCAMKLGA
jgi:hypothetical protein